MGTVVNQGIRCGSCGGALAESPNMEASQRLPCPACGSMTRQFDVHIEEAVHVSSYLAALKESGGQATGFSETARQGRTSGASLERGQLRSFVVGTSPQGEEDSAAACQVLLERLRADGEFYSHLLAGSEPADCTLASDDIRGARLDVQVVRATISQSFWGTLGNSGSIDSTMAIASVVQEIEQAISLKNNERRIPSRQRADLVLALDATRLPGFGFDAVVQEFRTTRSSWVASLGFKSVWLVGPNPRLCWRLDVA